MAQTIGGEEYLDVAEAALLLGVKPATLYAYVSRGVLPSFRQGVGRKRLYRRADVERLRAIKPGSGPPDDGVMRDVDLPDAESWAGEH